MDSQERSKLWRKNNPKRVKKYRKDHGKLYREQNKKKRIKYVQEYRKQHPERENAQKRAKKLRKDYCELCSSIENLDFHHIDYKTNKGFTACGSCHKLYCKEGISFEDSLELYKKGKEASVALES